MNRTRTFLVMIIAAGIASISPAVSTQAACPSASMQSTENVILLHGLCRTHRSMTKLDRALTQAGYTVWNVDYPSRTAPIEELADDAIGKAIGVCEKNGATRIDFVTHSMGGILVRSYLAHHSVPELGRVVMLTPPNQGSEIVDKLGGLALFKWINGPAGEELGTGTNSTPYRLGPANFPLGIIAGDRSINWINSLFFLPGRDDGKVTVARAKLAGMSDFRVIHATHSFVTYNPEAIRLTIEFLETGKFEP
jgi:triacylglycerol lipase